MADIIPEQGHDVWGVIYLLEDRDLSALDAAEGYRLDREPERNAYNRKNGIKVFAENDLKQTMRVSTYFAVRLPTCPALRGLSAADYRWCQVLETSDKLY